MTLTRRTFLRVGLGVGVLGVGGAGTLAATGELRRGWAAARRHAQGPGPSVTTPVVATGTIVTGSFHSSHMTDGQVAFAVPTRPAIRPARASR